VASIIKKIHSKSFYLVVADVRGEERDALKRSLLVQSLFAALPTVIPVFAPAFTFLAMTLAGADLTVTQVTYI